MDDIMAAAKPIIMASQGWRTADMETLTATPPARMQDCRWIWKKIRLLGASHGDEAELALQILINTKMCLN